MRVARLGLLFLAIASVALWEGCSRKTRPAKGASGQEQASSSLVPTPDNTPVESLRTPAGLVLKSAPEPTGTPSPPAAAAPSSGKAAP